MLNSEEYWINRAENRLLNAEKSSSELLKDMKKLYQDTINKLNKEIEAFIGRYSEKQGLTIQDTKKLLTNDELKRFRQEAMEYYSDLSKHAYDPAYRNKLKSQIYSTLTKDGKILYSLRRNISRLDYLKMQLQFLIENMYMKENEAFTAKLSKTYEEAYMRSTYDSQKAVGVYSSFNSLNSSIVNKVVQEKWLGENYSSRIWKDKNSLVDTLETTFAQDVAMGKNPREIARDISKKMGVKYSNCERLARTEFNHIANQATKDSYNSTQGIDEYKYVATLDSRTSEVCFIGTDKVQSVSDVEKLFKRNYTGDIITITTASGNQITGTPNHPILTSDGWLSLNKIEPNKHVVYSIIDNAVGITSKKNINMPTEMSKLFNSISKISTIEVKSRSSSATKFDNSAELGESKIDIINTNRILRNWRKFVIDKHFKNNLFAFCHNSIILFAYRMINFLGIRDFVKVATPEAQIFSFSKSVEPTSASIEFFNDDRWSNSIIKHFYGFSPIRKIIDITLASFEVWSKSIFLKKISNSCDGGRIFFCYFRSGHAVPVFEENIVSKSVKFTNGCHVYNLQTSDNTYINNNIIVHNCQNLDGKVFPLNEAEEGINYPPLHPNCRSVTVPYFEDEDYSKLERIACDPKSGKSYFIPADMTYADWKASLSEEQGKYFVANKKSKAQYKSDLKQLNEYRKLATQAKKQGYGELFDTMPTRISEFQSMKYLQPEKWDIFKENARIARSELND